MYLYAGGINPNDILQGKVNLPVAELKGATEAHRMARIRECVVLPLILFRSSATAGSWPRLLPWLNTPTLFVTYEDGEMMFVVCPKLPVTWAHVPHPWSHFSVLSAKRGQPPWQIPRSHVGLWQ
jgi:hypothetical protein